MTNQLLNHLRPVTLAQLIAELINDHADEMDTGEFTFHTEDARAAYADLLTVGYRLVKEEYFWTLIEEALAHVN
jgi:hypothetical protein